jgi:hypothetical protein
MRIAVTEKREQVVTSLIERGARWGDATCADCTEATLYAWTGGWVILEETICAA